ncbi:hypothetical protein AGMMS49944_15030 [Spirochaetia bacterium]|nr:hypothetical protein AGMMS49944_15030 [Spirochaetia bacterium]
MRIIADLHLHSPYSRATSRRNSPAHLERWAQIKGINLAGTGDCTHPQWLADLTEALTPAEEGFYILKEDTRRDFDRFSALEEGLPHPAEAAPVRFVLTGEISTIYSRDGKTRKVHHVILLPCLEAAAAFQARLEKVGGNIRSDGRPILGLDSRDLLEMLLESDSQSMLIPAHIWTPWFSALGARSGFDSIDECYRDLSPHIHAIETGLSSNPPMNWAVKSLDRFAIISNSDAHSPNKLGREATVLEMEYAYPALAAALAKVKQKPAKFGPAILETLEFFPQEGKYHYDGHRNCGVSLSPEENAANGPRVQCCPVCGSPLTPGVLGRVRELAGQLVSEDAPCPPDFEGTNRRPYRSLIPLEEMLGEILGVGTASKKVKEAYGMLIEKAGSEFAILMDRSIGDIERLNCPGIRGELLSAAVDRMRKGEVSITAGYDGVYGIIRAFPPGMVPGDRGQGTEAGLFEEDPYIPGSRKGINAECIGTNAKRIGTNAECIGTNAECIGTNAECIGTNAGCIGTNAECIGTNAKRIGTNAECIGINTECIGINAKRIGTNAECIGINAKRIGINVECIGINAECIGTNAKRIGINAECIGTNAEYTGISASRGFIPDPDQERAINHPGGPAMIIAGPGTGKTAVLARSIARLMDGPDKTGVRVLALSFTVKAAEELRERISRIMGSIDAAVLTVGTFHSLGRSILKVEAAQAGLRDDFTILDEEARAELLKSITAGKKPRVSAGRLGSYIEERKRFLLLPGDTTLRLGPAAEKTLGAAASDAGIQPPDPALDRLYGEYREALLAGNTLDFDDLLAGTARLLAAKPELPAKYRERFTHIFADEYQDINFAQYVLLMLLAGEEIRVIGDPNQAIYGFRGASNRYMDRFLADYPGTAVYRLNKSFRCAEPIIRAANSLTGTNLRGTPGAVASETVCLYRTPYPTDRAEAEGITRRIDALIGGTGFFAMDSGTANSNTAGLTSLGQCAILIRAAALAPPIEEALKNHGIPYRLMGENLEDIRWSTEEVALMTIHASKGLEFDHVFVSGLEEGILPFTLFGADKMEDIAEELRLLYVAMTRARNGLHLSWAASRSFRGRTLTLGPSRFLAGLESLIPELKQGIKRERDKQPDLFS